MRLHVPINGNSNISRLAALGADGFYCGYLFRKDRLLNSVLSRHKGEKANFSSKEALSAAGKIISSLRKTLSIAINEHFFPKKFLPDILSDINDFLQMDMRYFIISDINLLLLVKKKHPEANLIASTGMHVMNSNLIRFLKKMGIDRIVLPRHLTLREMKEIIATNPKTEFEIFVKNIACANIDGFCSYLHGSIDKENYPAVCHALLFDQQQIVSDRHLSEFACAACTLWDLMRTNNKSLIIKIVGRSSYYNDIIEKDVTFFNTLKGMLNSVSKNLFKKRAREYYERIYGLSCPKNCYY